MTDLTQFYAVVGVAVFAFVSGIVVSCGEGPPGPFDDNETVAGAIDRLTEVVREKECSCEEEE